MTTPPSSPGIRCCHRPHLHRPLLRADLPPILGLLVGGRLGAERRHPVWIVQDTLPEASMGGL